MRDIPFSIPESLASYVVQFESDPERTIERLKKQLQKRGPDAVGYFLLAWFYHRREMRDNAIECALKAKTFAPGSPFFDKLHYFFSHPKMFEAWRYSTNKHSLAETSFYSNTGAGPILDLNTLIEKLSKVESRKLRREDIDSASKAKISQNDDSDDIASETLAKIHEQQQKYEAAIKTYKKLLDINPDKKEHYQEEIERVTELLENKSD